MPAPKLRYADVAGGAPFLAAFVPIVGVGATSGIMHSHDFTEFTLIRRGRAEHRVNGVTVPVSRGDLVYVRPSDTHQFASADRAGCDIVNVAFPSPRWHDFCRLAGFAAVEEWHRGELPYCVNMNGTGLAATFDLAARRSAEGALGVDAVVFWAAVASAVPSAADASAAPPPAWLSRARDSIRTEEDLRTGVLRLLEVAAVSHGHLARAMGRFYAQTPVQFVNERRLARAALLLTTTDETIGSVAFRSGYSSQSYFDRRFARRYGCSPREWRYRARRAVRP